ncbi:MAG: mechanosensitive ion channel family protein [Acidimicrobiia bacterium]|nr:mechanosensitive ion channel family protein [Acidimicrobiia bacterium]
MFLAQEEIDLGEITAQDWITAAIILGVTIVATMIVRRVTGRVLARMEMDTSPARLVARFLAALVFLGGFVYALTSLGIAIGPLLGALGVGGLALAFALQDIIENFIAGIMLQTRRPFRIGDQVVAGGYTGTVEDINLRTTILKTFDGRRVLVPSADVLKSGIENNTAFPERRTTLMVGVGYGTDLAEARDRMLGAMADCETVLDDPAPQAFVESFGGSSIDFAVRFWHPSRTANQWNARHEVALAVKQALDEAGIEIPFPIRTIDLAPDTADVLRARQET